jgi:hypothetical protein
VDGTGADTRAATVSQIGVADQIADAFLRRSVGDRPQQRETATFAIDGVLPRRNVTFRPALPEGKADQLQACQRPGGEVQLGVGELARRIPLVAMNVTLGRLSELDHPEHGADCLRSVDPFIGPHNISRQIRLERLPCSV